jgi:hypothetical protein
MKEGFMDKTLFIEKMLESENLTGELPDPLAKWLLDWGIRQLDVILEGVSDREIAAKKVNMLMAVIRKLSQLVGGSLHKTPQERAAGLASLDALFSQTFVNYVSPKPDAMDAIAGGLDFLPQSRALEYLVKSFLPALDL